VAVGVALAVWVAIILLVQMVEMAALV